MRKIILSTAAVLALAMLSRAYAADLAARAPVYKAPVAPPGGAFLATSFGSRITDNIIRVGINYKFGG